MGRLKWRNWPLAYKGVSVIALLVVVTALTTTLLAIIRLQESFRNELQEQAELLLTTIEIYSRDDLYYLDVDTINDVMENLGEEELVFSFGRAYDPDGRILADAYDESLGYQDHIDPFGKHLLESEGIVFEWQADQLLAGVAVRVGAQRFGAVAIGLPTAPLADKIADLRNQGVVTALAATLVGTLVAVAISRTITNPIRKLTDVAGQLSQGDLAQRVTTRSGGEIGLLANTINQMADELQKTLAKLERRTQELETSGAERSLLLDFNRALLAAQFDVHEISDAIAKNFIEFAGGPECSVSLLSPDKKNLIVHSDYEFDEGARSIYEEGIGEVMVLDDYPATARAMETLQPYQVLASDPDADPAELAYMKEWDVKVMVILPLAARGEAFGIIELEFPGEDAELNQARMDMAMSFANQSASVLEHALEFQSAQEDARREALIADIGQRIQSTTAIDEALQVAVREIGRALGAETSVKLRTKNNA